MADFFQQFQSPTTTSATDLFNWQPVQLEPAEEEPEKRSLIERILAPVEAPKQFLWSLTTNVADEGFQFGDIWKATVHGARYFNPWSNEAPIEADAVRQAFFGEQAKASPLLRGTENLALALLYDPLLFVPIGAATGLLREGATATKVLESITNPASLAVDMMLKASKEALGPLSRNVAVNMLGRERATKWGTAIAQNVFNKNFGVPTDLVKLVSRKDQNIAAWRQAGFNAIRSSQKLGGAKAQRLLADALELDAAYTARSGGELTRDMTRQLDSLNARIDKAGIDRDTFWNVYDNFRVLDDNIGKQLLDSGAINAKQFETLRGTHLRRMYQMTENPEVYVKRIEDLTPEQLDAAGLTVEDRLRTNNGRLYENLSKFKDELKSKLLGTTPEQDSMFMLQDALGIGPKVAKPGPTPRQILGKNYGVEGDRALFAAQEYGGKTADDIYQDAVAAVNTPNPSLENLYLAARAAPDDDAFEAMEFARRGLSIAKQRGDSAYYRAFQGFLRDSKATKFGASTRYIVNTGKNAGEFNVKDFVEDLDVWLRNNDDATIDTVLDHVKNVMMRGVNLPEQFMADLANHISDGGLSILRGTKYYADRIRAWSWSPLMTWHTLSERLKLVSERENIPELIREAMGEVLEASPRLSSQVSNAGLALETHKLFDEMAGVRRLTDDDLRIVRDARNGTSLSVGDAQRLDALAAKLGTSKQDIIDNADALAGLDAGTLINKTGSRWASTESAQDLGHIVHVPKNEAYGELSEMWVSPAVASMLSHMQGITQAGDPAGKLALTALELLRRGTGLFKSMKVLLDPVAQVTNFVGNAVLLDMGGTSPFRVDIMKRAANELVKYGRSGELGKYMKLADDAGLGLFTNTMSSAELADFARTISVDVGKPKNWRDVFTNAHAAMQRANLDPLQQAAKAFDFNERLFKMTAFMDRMDRLEGNAVKAGTLITDEMRKGFAEQAAGIAEQSLFNYADVPYLVEFARKYGIIPFATFPFKAAPFIAKTLYQHPYRVLKYSRAVNGVNAMLAGSSVDASKEIEALPEHVRDDLVLRLPFSDGQGRPQYLDLSYFLPWSVLSNLVETFTPTSDRADEGGFRSGLMSPPAVQLVDALRRNEDGLGRPIMDPTRSAAQNFGAIASYLWKFIAPPSYPGGSRADSIGRAMQAMATTDPQKLDYAARVGAFWRGHPIFPQASETILSGPGFQPQSQSSVSAPQVTQAIGGILAALGVQDTTAFQPGSRLGTAEGFLQGTLLSHQYASDTTQAQYQTNAKFQATRAELFKQRAAIVSDMSLSIAEKNRRIRRIMERLQDQAQDTSAQFRAY